MIFRPIMQSTIMNIKCCITYKDQCPYVNKKNLWSQLHMAWDKGDYLHVNFLNYQFSIWINVGNILNLLVYNNIQLHIRKCISGLDSLTEGLGFIIPINISIIKYEILKSW